MLIGLESESNIGIWKSARKTIFGYFFYRSSPLLSAKAAFRSLGLSFYAHRAGETAGIFAGAALLRIQYICCRYPQTRPTPRTDGLRPATFFQKVALAPALLKVKRSRSAVRSCSHENPYSVLETAKAIEEYFNEELVVLPWDRCEIYGHADGLVRYVGDGRVLLTNYDRFNKRFTRMVVNVLKQHFSDVYKLEYDVPKQHKHNWAYINWLQTDKLLLLPSFGCPEDEQAFEQISSMMPMYKGCVEMVSANDLIRHEGCLDCASWTVRM